MTESAQPNQPEFKQIASWRHLAIVVGIMLAIAVRGMTMHSGEAALSMNHTAAYLSLILIEGALVYLIWRGIKTTNTTIDDLVGGRWKSLRDVLRDVALAFGLWVALMLVVAAWRYLSGNTEVPTTVSSLLPHTSAERALWILLSISAGVGEEITFRGYCQRQFEALTGNRWIALALQSLLFGVSHGYQGVDAMLKITVLGLAFGLMAIWRRSLRPGIIAHAWTDTASGLLGAA